MYRYLALLLLIPQQATFDVRPCVKQLAEKCENAKQYSFEGELTLARQRGVAPGNVLAKAKVKVAVGEEGKYLFRLEPDGKNEYWLVSNGEKTWAYIPKLKQYTEQESAALQGDDEEEQNSDDPTETYVRQVIPTLAKMWKTAQSAGAAGTGKIKYEGQKQEWPVVQVMSKPDERAGTNLTQLTIDPGTLRVGRLIWTNVTYPNREKSLVQMALDFHSFNIGEAIPPDTFNFTPPANAKRVDAVPIPGQNGGALLNLPAPDFELKNLDGEKIHLSALRGHPVMLSFWASWCGPCRRELPDIDKLNKEYKDKGVVVLGVNDEGKGIASKFLQKEGLSLPTLDDSNQKAYRLYRVHSIPTTFVIDANGKIVRFLSGGRDPETLRQALKSAGM